MPKWKLEFCCLGSTYPSKYYMHFFDTFEEVLSFLHTIVSCDLVYVEIEYLDGVSFEKGDIS